MLRQLSMWHLLFDIKRLRLSFYGLPTLTYICILKVHLYGYSVAR